MAGTTFAFVIGPLGSRWRGGQTILGRVYLAKSFFVWIYCGNQYECAAPWGGVRGVSPVANGVAFLAAVRVAAPTCAAYLGHGSNATLCATHGSQHDKKRQYHAGYRVQTH